MTDEELRKLLDVAKAATPGPWSRKKPTEDDDGWSTDVAVAATPGRQAIYASPPGGSYPSADCDYIATFDPPTAIALVTEVQELRASLASIHADIAAAHAAILDIDAHATPLGYDSDGFVAVGYVVSVGAIHRALALTGASAECRDVPCARAAAAEAALASERAAREAAERDTERLDWMIANDAWIHAADRVKVRRTQETERVYQVEWSDGDGGWYETNIDAAPNDARAAIDEARAAQAKEGSNDVG